MMKIVRCITTGFAFAVISIASAAAAERPVAVVTAGMDPSTGDLISAVTLFIGPADQGIPWTLSGRQSHDPAGRPLTYRWDCSNRHAISGVPKNEPDLQGFWPEGEHSCTLTVNAGGFEATDTGIIKVKVDTTAPRVTAPEDIMIASTEPGGVRMQDSADLRAWLNSAMATDNAGGTPRSLPPLIASAAVDGSTLFPLGTPTTVTFRFEDVHGNVGQDEAKVTVKDLREGDIFVGSAKEINSFGARVGVIRRLRSGVSEVFCESTSQNSPYRWGNPENVIVDSEGRVVFLATISSGNSNFPHRALFACEYAGDMPRLLALYPGWAVEQRPVGDPVHEPGALYGAVNGLHLARTKAVVIDDNENDGLPQTVAEDSYVFAANKYDRSAAEYSRTEAVRYRSLARSSEPGPDIVPGSGGNRPPDMTNFGGSTYSARANRIGRTGNAFRFEASGSVVGIPFQFSLTLGAALRQIGEPHRTDNYLSDDLTKPDYDSGCRGTGDISSLMPSPKGGPHIGFTAIEDLVVDPAFGGLVLTSSHVGLPNYMLGVSQVWLDDNPLNDNCCRFTRYELDCDVQHKIGYQGLDTIPRADRLVVAPDGILAIDWPSIIRIRAASSHEEVVATDRFAVGLAVWPPQKTEPSGNVVVVRVDSPVDVLLTDSAGRRIGVDSAGVAVNDFGDVAFDSGAASHPRFYIIRDAAPGTYRVDSVGTGEGPFTIHVYSHDLSERYGDHVRTSGVATIGARRRHDFVLAPAGLTFVNDIPRAAAGPDQTVTATSPDGTVVTLDASASADDGDTLSYKWSGPFGIAAGRVVHVQMPRGAHVVTLYVEDEHGAQAEDEMIVLVEGTLDTTPPVLTATRVPLPNAFGWTNRAITITFSCADAESGVAVPPVTPQVVATEGRAQSLSAECKDAVGNVATLTIDDINIDMTPPTLVGTLAPVPNGLGWNNTDVTASFACADALAGVDEASVTPDATLTSEGAMQSVSGTCRDLAGNEAMTAVNGINIDKTAPVAVATRTPAPNASGWNNTAVAGRFEASDALSGISGQA
ncbi:MAG TPA: hypothetical protein VFT12_05245, partial [Thermoanaerobaculia bacterium]|nr:hypothetical protein [Thermoanaerobaculia bacterium]